MDACAEMSCWFNLGSDERTVEEYKRNAVERKNFIYFDEKKHFKDQAKEYGESVSAACSTVEISSTTKERQSKRKSSQLLALEELVKIAKEQQQQEQDQQVIAPKTSRRRRKSSSS